MSAAMKPVVTGWNVAARRALTWSALMVAPLSCASADLGPAGGPQDIAAALGRGRPVSPRPVNEAGRPLAYLALGGTGGARLAAFDLGQSKVLWSVSAPLTGRVVAGASVLVHAHGPFLVGRDVNSGAERWRSPVPTGEILVGYAIDDDTVFFVARKGNELRGGQSQLIALSGRTGATLWTRPLGSANVGGPAARGGIVAVPNRSQFVSLFDGSNGNSLGQALSKEQAANFVTAAPEGFFYGFGADGAYLLSSDTAVGVRSSAGYLHARFPPFVRPVYHRDMYKPELTDYSAIDRNRVLWRASVQGPRATFANGGMVCVLNYRFFFGFDAVGGALRWAYNNPAVEAAGAAHTGTAIVFATADGELGALDPVTGQRTYRARLAGETIVGATFDAEGYAPAGGVTGQGTPSLTAALSSMVWDPDRRFPEAQLFAVDQLARIPGREVTAELLWMLAREDLPQPVVKRAARALEQRQDATSVDLLVQALRVHADFVEGTSAAAVANLEVLARAAATLRAHETAGPLAEHLRLPETPPAAVREIARALAVLQAGEALPALRDYLVVYRADPGYSGDPSPLLAVADALLKLGGPSERELLLFVAEDRRTLPRVREYVRRALSQTATTRLDGQAEVGAAQP